MDSIYELSEKIKSTQNVLNVLTVKLYSIGSLFIENDFIKRKIRFNLLITSLSLSIILMREVLSLLLKNRNISLMLGDFAFDWKLKSMWNSIMITAVLQ